METNMKKLLALLMALMMCCTAFAFAEEEAEVPAVEMNVSFEAQTVALGETGLTMQIPADWAVQEVPAGTETCLGKVHSAENMRELTGKLRECRNFQQEKGRETSN